MAASVDLDLNCRPPSPEPAAPEEPRRAMLRQEQPFSNQTKDLHKLYGSFWKQSGGAPSSLHSTHVHKPMSLDGRGIPNPHVSSNSNKRKMHSDVAEQNLDVRSSTRRKPDAVVPEKRAYRDMIDLEKPATSDDASEIVACSGFGNAANHIGRSQDGSCCVSPENSSLAESGQPCRRPNSTRVSTGSVGSSETPDCQSPIKPSNTESRLSLIDLNVPQEESLHRAFCVPSQEIFSPSFHSSQNDCGSSMGSLKESSITVTMPSSAANSSRGAAAVQRQCLIDLNMPLESTEMPSEIISGFRDKVVKNDGNRGTVPYHFYSKINSLQAETLREHMVVGNDHKLATKDDNNVLRPISPANGIKKARSVLYVPETLVDNHACPRLGLSHDGPSVSRATVSLLQAEAEGDDKVAATAAETLLSIFRHNSTCAADCPGRNSQTSAQDGKDEPQCSLDSFEKIVLNLEEVKDDGQSIHVIPPDKYAPSCGIKLRRGRGMRNFQREIIPGLVSLARQEICDDLDAIGYEPKKTRSRKTRRGQGASSTRPRSRKRGGSTARN